MWGPCLAWRLASSQKRWWSPPSPPDMQANICAQTSQDSEKEFHSCAHLRLGCLALTPSPLHGMEVEGRGALPAHSVRPIGVGSLGEKRDGRGGIAPDASRATGIWCPCPRQGGFAHGHSLGCTEGFVLRCWAACGLLKIGKDKTLPSFTPKLLYPDQGASSKSVYPAAWVFWDGCLGAVQGPGCTGSRICPRMFIGNLHM